MNILPVILFCFLLAASQNVLANYDYPIENPIAATIVGTPEVLRITQDDLRHLQPDYVRMPEKKSQFQRNIDKEYRIIIHPERNIPEVFWTLLV